MNHDVADKSNRRITIGKANNVDLDVEEVPTAETFMDKLCKDDASDSSNCISLEKQGLMHRTLINIEEGLEGIDIREGIHKIIEMEKELDDRLFPDHPLYCEGLMKPKLRGMIHLFYALLMPLGMLHLYTEANGSVYGQVAGVVFVLSNLYCVGVSALYHIGSWSVSTEIFIQKLDHCGISIYAAGVNFPVSLLLLSQLQGATLLTMSVASTSWICWHIFNNRPAVWRFLVVSICIVLFFPVLYYKFTTFEFTCALLNILVQGSGMAVFVNRAPSPWPSVFGYHELFHFICIIGMTITYICNWSIIRRTCNPYARHTDIVELVMHVIATKFI